MTTVPKIDGNALFRAFLSSAILALVAVSGILPVTSLNAQNYGTADIEDPATRQELESRLERLQQVVARGKDGTETRDARRRISVLRSRLSQGDFQSGDVIRIRVRGDSSLTGSFRIDTERWLDLPAVEDIDMRGVLYSEADSVIREHLSNYLKDPSISVQLTRRIAILGAVQKPGFYDLPPATTLSDALMMAGGPTARAKLRETKVRRDGRDLLKGRDVNLRRITLADLGPSSNDELFVPAGGKGFGAMEILGVVSGLAGSAWAISQIF